ncbi:MAG: OsmC family peroxiredoxin [Chloroflexota bacterium]|nr:MAG: OsmC family peroxiredoxin [Chloroflexota bacterium]
MDCSDNSCSINGTGSIRVSWDKQTGCEARIGNFPPISIDMPVRHGGAGKHPCPHELLFTAVGSCFLGTFLVFQRQLRLNLIDLQVSVEGSVEQATSGKNLGKYDITGIDVQVMVVVEGSEDETDIVRDCIRITKEHCPTTRALQGSVPINIVSEIRIVSE